MNRGVNKALILGYVGQDPETRYTGSGNAVTSIRVATSESWKDKQTGQQQDRTEWHKIIFFNKLAEIAGQYLKKGSKVYIEGSLRTRKWQDKDTGKDRYSTEIVASELQMIDSKPEGQQGFQSKPAPQSNQAPKPGQGFQDNNGFDDDIDSSIPF